MSTEPTAEQIEAMESVASQIARRYARRTSVERDDLRQVASLAAWRAHGSYRADRGATYATWLYESAAGEVRHYLRDLWRPIRPPRSLLERAAQGDAVAIDKLKTCIPFSLESVVGYDGDGKPVSYDQTHGACDPGMDEAEVRVLLAQCLRRPRDRLVAFLYGFQGWSETQIAAALGCTQARVSRILRRAQAQMRQAVAAGPG